MKITRKFINTTIFLTSMSDIAFILLIFIVIISLLGAQEQKNILLPYSVNNNKYDEKSINIYINNSSVTINETTINNPTESDIKNILINYNKSLSIKIFADRKILFLRVKKIIGIINRLKFNKFEFATNSLSEKSKNF